MRLNILSIAGSDPSGGAGVVRDVRVATQLGCHGMAAVAALTAQNSRGVQAIEPVAPDFLRAQVTSILEDMDVQAIKIGMLGTAENMRAVADVLPRGVPAVLDPVMRSSSGGDLMKEGGLEALCEALLPVVDVITPNIPEAEKLTRKAVLDLEDGARGVQALGARAVLLTGGHLKGADSPDTLITEDGVLHILNAPRVDVGAVGVRGTGCALSMALACYLAEGLSLPEAATRAKIYVREHILCTNLN